MLEVLAVIAIVAYVIGRQLLGESLRGKRVVVLPLVLTVVGLTRLGSSGHPVRPLDVAFLAAGALVAAAIGAGQGAMMRLEAREGGLWGRMPVRGLLLWVALVAVRVLSTLLAGAMGAHVAASSAPIVFLLGVNRLGQAAAITYRAWSAGIPFAREKDGSVFLADRLSPGTANTANPSGTSHHPRPSNLSGLPGVRGRRGGLLDGLLDGVRNGTQNGPLGTSPRGRDRGADRRRGSRRFR
jgi:hypothetical protein